MTHTIKVLMDFKDGRDEYFQDEERKVTAVNCEYFCANGWAEDLSGDFSTGVINHSEVRLDIRKTTIGQTAEKVG